MMMTHVMIQREGKHSGNIILQVLLVPTDTYISLRVECMKATTYNKMQL